MEGCLHPRRVLGSIRVQGAEGLIERKLDHPRIARHTLAARAHW